LTISHTTPGPNPNILGNLDSNSTTVKITSQSVEHTDRPEDDRRFNGWKLRRFVQDKLATNKSIRKCGVKCIQNKVGLEFNHGTGKSNFSGVFRCKSKICPVCQKQIIKKKIDNMNKVIEHESLKDFVFITLTGAHSWETNLSDFHKNMTESFREVFRGTFKKKLKKYGFFTYVRSVDYTFTRTSKHHLHNHIVLMFNQRLSDSFIEELKEDLYQAYSYQMNKRGIDTDKSGYYFERVQKGKDKIVKYLLKEGSISYEMFNTFSKINPGQISYTIWQVLEMYYNTGDKYWKNIWIDYQRQMKNQKLTTVGSEYNKLLKQIESNIEEPESKTETITELNPFLYEMLYKRNLCIPILQNIELYNRDKNHKENKRKYNLIISCLNEINEYCYEFESNVSFLYSLTDTFKRIFYQNQKN
jgi:hypothetical protein